MCIERFTAIRPSASWVISVKDNHETLKDAEHHMHSWFISAESSILCVWSLQLLRQTYRKSLLQKQQRSTGGRNLKGQITEWSIRIEKHVMTNTVLKIEKVYITRLIMIAKTPSIWQSGRKILYWDLVEPSGLLFRQSGVFKILLLQS